MITKNLTVGAFIVFLSGCASKPDNYDKNDYAAFVDVTVLNLANTKPSDFEKDSPMISLREMCKKFTVDPVKHRDEMLDIAASVGETRRLVQSPGTPELRLALSRRDADFIYQDCRAEYLMTNGATTAPLIKLKPVAEYKSDAWKQ